jgi:sigma-B regulation protein RsbU (phosphoserine phosphatase)
VGIVGTAAQRARPILVGDTRRDSRYVAVLEGILSEVAVPLMIKDRVIGVVDLESGRVNAFTAGHVRTLSLLAPQIAAAIENARLYEQVARDQERLERDLEAARQLQKQLLPAENPVWEGLELAARNVPATEVTGDLYDFFPFPDGNLGLLVGDVSGKGAAAALYAAMTSGLLRNLVQPGHRPADLLRVVNEALIRQRLGTRYLTAIFVKWCPGRRAMLLANAGEPHPIVRRNGTIEVLPVAGIPLGLLENSQYEEVELPLEPGDLIVLVSDGITETDDPEDQQYGEERLPDLVAAHPNASAAELVEAIFEDVVAFAAGAKQRDDRTVIVAKVTS